jgi:peptide deformylase
MGLVYFVHEVGGYHEAQATGARYTTARRAAKNRPHLRSRLLAIVPIRRAGDPVLREKARRVRVPIDSSIHRLIEDMWETMYDAPGVGLAAPQIGISLRIIVIDVPDHERVALVNPEIVKRSGERTVDEGCLSVPGFRGEITRSVKVLAKGIDPYTGKEVRIKAEDDLMAEALEHEIDHVNGILYIDYLPSPDALVPLGDAPEVRGQEQ